MQTHFTTVRPWRIDGQAEGSAATDLPPVVKELETVFGNLEDADLRDALIGPTRRGPRGHSAIVLWHCFVAKYRLGMDSTDAFIRALNDNPYLAKACGILSAEAIPHKSTFSRFFAKLSKRKYQHLVKDVSRKLVQRCYAELPGFGQRTALDSTTLKAWSNGGKTPKSDPDAGWSVKKGSNSMQEYKYGYKLHLLADCEYELPIAANVSAGNVHDVTRASNVLSEARYTTGKSTPRYVMLDAGYSSIELVRLIENQYSSKAILQVHPTHKVLQKRFADVKDTPEIKALAKQRTAVERAFSRLKDKRALNKITVRRRMKVTTHCYLSLIAMQVLYWAGVHPSTRADSTTLSSSAGEATR